MVICSFFVSKNGNKTSLATFTLCFVQPYDSLPRISKSIDESYGMRRHASHSPTDSWISLEKKLGEHVGKRETPVTWLQLKHCDLPIGRIRQKSPQHQCSVSPRHHIWLTPCRCSMQLFYWPWADFLVRLLEINIRKPAEMSLKHPGSLSRFGTCI